MRNLERPADQLAVQTQADLPPMVSLGCCNGLSVKIKIIIIKDVKPGAMQNLLKARLPFGSCW